MKYGILTYAGRPMRPGAKNGLNLGDPIQSYAMRYIYSRMGIGEKELVEISRYRARYYDGDYVILPYNCFNMIYNQFGHEYGTLPLSDKIIPVFLSFHLHSRYISEDILNNLRNFQPVGCRDEETMANMRRHGIRAWLSGCATAVLPKRTVEPEKPKCFFVDVPESLKEYIPKDILDAGEFVEHQVAFPHEGGGEFMTDREYRAFYDAGIRQLERYREEATLVVASRLHAAAPCLAMGIPVILAGNSFDGRFSFLDRYLRFYTPDKFEEIDWNPEPVEYEEEKEKMLQVFIRQIKKAYRDCAGVYDVSAYYESRTREVYNKGFRDGIRGLPVREKKGVKFGIWGITSQSLELKNCILDTCKGWEFHVIVDKTATGSFEGLEVTRPEQIEEQDKDIIYFVVPESAHRAASELLDGLGRSYVLMKEWQMECHF